jgi:hypothetical protein
VGVECRTGRHFCFTHTTHHVYPFYALIGVVGVVAWRYIYLYTISVYHRWSIEFASTLCDKVCQWIATGQWFSPGTPVSSTNKIDCHNITEIFLKVVLNWRLRLKMSALFFICVHMSTLHVNSYTYFFCFVFLSSFLN